MRLDHQSPIPTIVSALVSESLSETISRRLSSGNQIQSTPGRGALELRLCLRSMVEWADALTDIWRGPHRVTYVILRAKNRALQ